ncbi:putative acyl-protein thioesterase [Cladorrhinum sp. PSN259]|nr:putative acyl-protein thioesterase [Cladorrhinum sp. PSN259]
MNSNLNPPKLPLKTYTTPPVPGYPHTHTVIFLHGRGDTAQAFQASFLSGWKDPLSRSLAQICPTIKWIFPTAPIRPLARFPRDRISQWFDTWDINDLSAKEELQIAGLRESVEGIRQICQKEVQENLNGEWGRLVLAGFSQGGAAAAHTLLNLEGQGGGAGGEMRKLGGLMVFSGRMPFPGRSLDETREVLGLLVQAGGTSDDGLVVRNTPALVQHCADDSLSKVGNGRAVRDSLERFGAKVTWREYPVGGHWFHSPNGIEDTAAWLRQFVLQ